MFKKILEKLNRIESNMQSYAQALHSDIFCNSKEKEIIEELTKSLEYQTEMTTRLLDHMYEKDSTLECVVFVPYRGKPLVYKDGKKVSTDTMSSFDIGWSFDSKTEVTIRND